VSQTGGSLRPEPLGHDIDNPTVWRRVGSISEAMALFDIDDQSRYDMCKKMGVRDFSRIL